MPPLARRRSLLAVVMGTGLLAASVSAGSVQSAEAAVAAQVPASCSPAVALVNGGFESPAGAGPRFVNEASVDGWSTTASDDEIELWGPGTGVPTGSGDQFAELNATQASTLYQDVATLPGQVLKWDLQHRGRTGPDEMAVLLGPPAGPLVQQGGTIADDNTAWGTYSGLYTVPVGQTTTRFAFESISSDGGDPGIGNFLDSISLGNAACVIVSKTVNNTSRAGTDAVVGDILEYIVELDNAGGVPATGVVITDVVPVGTTYVPGSIGGSVGVMTDALLDDAGEYDAGTVRARVGAGAGVAAGGSIPAGQSLTLSFQAVVNSGTVGLTLANDASVSFVDSLSATSSISTSNTTSTSVLPVADLQVVQSLDTVLLANGDAIQYTFTVTNNGPDTSTDTELTLALPLLGMSANDPDCTVTLAQIVCDFGSLASAASRVVVVTGTVPIADAGGTTYQLDSSVAGSGYDPDPTNDTDTSIDTLPSIAALSAVMTITNVTPGSAGRPAYEGNLLRATYLLTNTGNADLTSLTVTDPVFGTVTCSPTSVTAVATAICSADVLYSVSALDVTNGSVSSVATAGGTAPSLGGQLAVATASGAISTGIPAAIALTGSSPQAGLLLAALLLLLGAVALGVAHARSGTVDPEYAGTSGL